jgi:hypothetical protein
MQHQRMEPTLNIKVSLVMSCFARANLLELGFISILRNKPDFKFEIVVVNDGFENDGTENICNKYKKQLNIKYYFTGQRNTDQLLPRNPAIPNNFAIRHATGDIVILTCPEIYHLNNAISHTVEVLINNKKAISVPKSMYFDNTGEFVNIIKSDFAYNEYSELELRDDHVQMPFLFGVWKENIEHIKGFDEDFVGYSLEDNDFVNRLLLIGCKYVQNNAEIVHLFHGERCSGVEMWGNPAWEHNKKLSDSRKGIIVRNKNIEWGMNVEADPFVLANFKGKTEYIHRIPKILHLYWEERPMSWLQTLTVKTFHKHNPDWKIFIYVPINKDRCPTKYIPDYRGKDYFSMVKKLPYVQVINVDVTEYGIDRRLHNILRSDIFRYYLLYNVGGVWSDFDVLWLKPIERLFSIKTVGKIATKDFGTFVCMLNTINGLHNISILISAPNHPLYKKLIDECLKIQNSCKNLNNLDHQVFGTVLLNNLYKNIDEVLIDFKDIVGFPYKTFYPYSIYGLNELYKEAKVAKVMDSDVICLHWWNGHKLSKEYVNKVNGVEDCSMTRIINLINKDIL